MEAIKGMLKANNQEVPHIIPTLAVLVVQTAVPKLPDSVRSLARQLSLELAIKETDADNATVIGRPVMPA